MASYLGKFPSQPEHTKRFIGSILRYVAAYNHYALYPENLPLRQLHEILPGIDSLKVCLQHKYEDKALPYGEAYVLAAIAAHVRPRKVFEIGTFTGGSALIITQQAGPDCRLFTLDMPPKESRLQLRGVEDDPPEADAARIGERFRSTEYESQITQLYGDSASFDYSPYAGQMDLVFVDGSHSYEYVLSDTRKALQMLSPTGTILWDDCATVHPGVAQALSRVGATLSISRIEQTRFAIYTRFL